LKGYTGKYGQIRILGESPVGLKNLKLYHIRSTKEKERFACSV